MERTAHCCAAFDEAAIGLAYLSTAGEWLQVNRSCCTILDRPARELVATPFLSLVHAGDRPALFRKGLRLLRGRHTRFAIDLRLLRSDSSVVWTSCSFALVEPSGDKPSFAVVSIADISDRKVAERRLQESEHRLTASTNMTGLGNFTWDLVADKCVYCSDEYARLHGMTAADYMREYAGAKQDMSLVHVDDREIYRQHMTSSLERYAPDCCEYRIVTPDGETRFVREVETAVEFEGDRAVRSEGTIQDITDIRRSEMQLQEAMKMQAIGQLSGGLAHNFNNLLAVLIGNVELLEDRLGPDVPELADIGGAARRGAELIENLLSFSRRQALDTQTLDPGEVVRACGEIVSGTSGAAIEVRTDVAADVWPAHADPALLRSAVLNLAINACDAMPHGGLLTIACANHVRRAPIQTDGVELDVGEYVVFDVSDTGPGMSDEVRRRAFEPFFTTKHPGIGNGLGLSMVYGFGRQSGGGVGVVTAKGRGTTVRLFLPRADGTAI